MSLGLLILRMTLVPPPRACIPRRWTAVFFREAVTEKELNTANHTSRKNPRGSECLSFFPLYNYISDRKKKQKKNKEFQYALPLEQRTSKILLLQCFHSTVTIDAPHFSIHCIASKCVHISMCRKTFQQIARETVWAGVVYQEPSKPGGGGHCNTRNLETLEWVPFTRSMSTGPRNGFVTDKKPGAQGISRWLCMVEIYGNYIGSSAHLCST